MDRLKIKLDEGAIMPVRAHATDAGLDLALPDEAHIAPGEVTMIDTKVHVEIPQGYVGLLCERSSLHKKGIALAHSVGVIDSGYTGAMRLPLRNMSKEDVTLMRGERVAQLLVIPCEHGFGLVVVDELADSERGAGGFGSTGE